MQQFNWPSGVSRGQLELRSSSVTRNLPSTSSKRGLPAKTGELVASTHTRPCAPNRPAGHEGELHGQSSTTLSDVLKVCGGVWGSREVNCRDPERSVPGIRRAIRQARTRLNPEKRHSVRARVARIIQFARRLLTAADLDKRYMHRAGRRPARPCTTSMSLLPSYKPANYPFS